MYYGKEIYAIKWLSILKQQIPGARDSAHLIKKG
jgi:hypothetical protein